jgi:hypothetical protein
MRITMNQNRFTVGLALVLAGLVWNIHYSVLSFDQPIGSPYAAFLVAGGLVVLAGAWIMALAFPGRRQPPGGGGRR